MPFSASENVDCSILNYSNDKRFRFWTHRLGYFNDVFCNLNKSIMYCVLGILLVRQDFECGVEHQTAVCLIDLLKR